MRGGYACRLALAMSGLLTLVANGQCAGGEPLRRFEFTQPQMGMPFRIVLYAARESQAADAARAAFARVAELNRVLSDYEEDSELVRLNRSAGSGMAVPVSPDLWRVLERAQRLAARTDGAFDVTVGPAVQLWRRARRQRELPAPERLAAALRAVGHRHLVLDARRRTARLDVPGMRLDLGGIAKGYALDEALAVLRGRGLPRALVSGGGDMAAGAPPPGARGWRIELAAPDVAGAPPACFVWLKNAGLATSGDLFQFVEIGGRRYSHIVDPRTGFGLTDHSLVTVIAPDCMTADSLATAVSVLGPEAGLRLVESSRSVAARIIRQPEGTLQRFESRRFARHVIGPEKGTPGR